MQALKPCPFCGARAAVHRAGAWFWIECTKCKCQTISNKDVEIVAEFWNRRSHDETDHIEG